MACNGGNCESGCNRVDEFSTRDHQDRPAKYSVESSDILLQVSSGLESSAEGGNRCIKCKVDEPLSTTHPSVTGGGDIGRFCLSCFRGNLFGKFRFAVTANAMISPSDNVLVAFSGGTGSRVALQFVHEMQQKAQKNFDASTDRSLPVFSVGVAYIDGSGSVNTHLNDTDMLKNELKAVVSSLGPPTKQFYVVPIEFIYSPEFDAGTDRLRELVASIHDVTGKEDFQDYLLLLCLQKFALENGYTKLVLGTCTSRLACRVLEATVKGQGFSLAADIQYVDARWDVPVVLPLRDCLSEELQILCNLDSLKTMEALGQPRYGINGLISSFVKLLQKENPSRESTIVRTAGKLTPFYFNQIPEADDSDAQLASRRRQKKYNLKPSESLPPKVFCFICHSPLKKSEITSSHGSENGETSPIILKDACSSCLYQILPDDFSSFEHFQSLLPQSMSSVSNDHENGQKLLRNQIQDCLLSDTDEGT